MRQNWPILLLFLSLLISVAYLAFPHRGEVHFAFSDEVLSYKQWTYFIGEHLILVILGGAILLYEKRFRLIAWTFFLIQVADTIDFVLTYAEPWTKSLITFNNIKIAVFLLALILTGISHVGSSERN